MLQGYWSNKDKAEAQVYAAKKNQFARKYRYTVVPENAGGHKGWTISITKKK